MLCAGKLNIATIKELRKLSLIYNNSLRLLSTGYHCEKMKIGTHDGVFHCDEVLACAMLRILPEYKDAEIVRTRNIELLNQCDVVVDVGAVFDHEKKRYDHHQREFTATLSTLRPEVDSKYNIRLSSAGLIYTYYGEEVIKQVNGNKKLSPTELSAVYRKVYETFIQEIDAVDNGVPMTDGEPKYRIHTDISKRVGRLNPDWNCKQNISIDDVFRTAMKTVEDEFLYAIDYYSNVWLPAREYLIAAFEDRKNVHASGSILVFHERFPWKEHLFDLESELSLEGVTKYVVFIDKPGSWRVQAVPVARDSFVLRKPLCEKWWGMRDTTLCELSGIDGCIFCHSNGFIGGNASKEGALNMAVASLQA